MEAPDEGTVHAAHAAHAAALWQLRVKESGDQPAFFAHPEDMGSWREMSWRQADAAAREVAAGLIALGVGPGDRVCIVSQTRRAWFLCDIGILLAGAISVPIYATSTAEQCAFIVNDAAAKVVVIEDAAQMEKLLTVRSRMPSVTKLVFFAGDVHLERPDERGRSFVPLGPMLAAAGAFAQSFDDLRAAGRALLSAQPDAVDRRIATIKPESTYTVIYTSGTTGNPKGVVLSQANLTSAMAAVCRLFGVSRGDHQYLWLPLAHVLGREIAWASVQGGAPIWFTRGVTHIKEDLAEVRPTFMVGVPRIFEKFYVGVQQALSQGSAVQRALVRWAVGVGRRASDVTKAAAAAAPSTGVPADPLAPTPALTGTLAFQHRLANALVLKKLRAKLGLDRCRFLVSGGAPLAPEIAAYFHALGLLVLEGYGLSETVGAAYVNRPGHYRFGTVGLAIDGVEGKIAEDGEILLRGSSVFKEYFNNPRATQESIDPDGWFHSGDIGELDDGYLRITDRKKDLIVTAGGKKVAPQPIENALKARLPVASYVVVYGEQRPYCVALVALTEEASGQHGGPEAAAKSEALRAAIQQEVDAVNATLAPYETIKKFAVLGGDLTEARGEVTPSLKVKRKVVNEHYKETLDRLYA